MSKENVEALYAAAVEIVKERSGEEPIVVPEELERMAEALSRAGLVFINKEVAVDVVLYYQGNQKYELVEIETQDGMGVGGFEWIGPFDGASDPNSPKYHRVRIDAAKFAEVARARTVVAQSE